MFKLVLVLLLAFTGSLITEATRTVSSHISSDDLQRFQKIFVGAFASNDLQGIYYASINIEPSQATERTALCKKIVTLHEESKLNEFEKDYYLVGAHKHLKCSEKLPEKLLNSVYNALKTGSESAQELYYRVASHSLLNVQIDESSKTKIVKALEEILKKEDSMVNIGYAFNIAPHLGQSGEFLTQRIGDVISYADEVDGKLLQFEGGLSITALVINGIFKMSKQYNSPVPMTEDKAAKFASYFLSRRSVQTPKGVHVLIEALKVLSNAGNIAPVCVQVLGNGQVLVESPTVTVAIVDLLGKALSPTPQSVLATIQLQKDKTVTEKIQFVPRSSDKTLFSADLKGQKLNKGIYVAEISVDNTYKQSLIFKVLGRVKVNNVEVSIADSDGSVAATKYSATYAETLKDALSADSTQKLILKALLEDKDTNKPITVHQVFMRLLNKKTDQEIIFIAEQDSSKAYRFEVDFGSRSADFAHKTGDYELYLIVGDASISNSFEWLVANIRIKFAHEPLDTGKRPARQPLPEIVHQFRVPEKRPSRLVSDVFTGLCITPLVLLFIFWSKIGLNVSNFNFYPSTIGFHLGFGGMLALFAVFWLQLDMFQTLRFLIPLVIFTFLCGNRLLRRLYAQRVSSSKSANAT